MNLTLSMLNLSSFSYYNNYKDILEKWMDQQLGQVEEELGFSIHGGNIADAVQKIVPILSMGFREIVRQVSVSCIERGKLLDRIWKSFSDLFDRVLLEMKSTIENYEAKIAELEEENDEAEDLIKTLRSQHAEQQQKVVVGMEKRWSSKLKPLQEATRKHEAHAIKSTRKVKELETEILRWFPHWNLYRSSVLQNFLPSLDLEEMSLADLGLRELTHSKILPDDALIMDAKRLWSTLVCAANDCEDKRTTISKAETPIEALNNDNSSESPVLRRAGSLLHDGEESIITRAKSRPSSTESLPISSLRETEAALRARQLLDTKIRDELGVQCSNLEAQVESLKTQNELLSMELLQTRKSHKSEKQAMSSRISQLESDVGVIVGVCGSRPVAAVGTLAHRVLHNTIRRGNSQRGVDSVKNGNEYAWVRSGEIQSSCAQVEGNKEDTVCEDQSRHNEMKASTKESKNQFGFDEQDVGEESDDELSDLLDLQTDVVSSLDTRMSALHAVFQSTSSLTTFVVHCMTEFAQSVASKWNSHLVCSKNQNGERQRLGNSDNIEISRTNTLSEIVFDSIVCTGSDPAFAAFLMKSLVRNLENTWMDNLLLHHFLRLLGVECKNKHRAGVQMDETRGIMRRDPFSAVECEIYAMVWASLLPHFPHKVEMTSKAWLLSKVSEFSKDSVALPKAKDTIESVELPNAHVVEVLRKGFCSQNSLLFLPGSGVWQLLDRVQSAAIINDSKVDLALTMEATMEYFGKHLAKQQASLRSIIIASANCFEHERERKEQAILQALANTKSRSQKQAESSVKEDNDDDESISTKPKYQSQTIALLSVFDRALQLVAPFLSDSIRNNSYREYLLRGANAEAFVELVLFSWSYWLMSFRDEAPLKEWIIPTEQIEDLQRLVEETWSEKKKLAIEILEAVEAVEMQMDDPLSNPNNASTKIELEKTSSNLIAQLEVMRTLMKADADIEDEYILLTEWDLTDPIVHRTCIGWACLRLIDVELKTLQNFIHSYQKE